VRWKKKSFQKKKTIQEFNTKEGSRFNRRHRSIDTITRYVKLKPLKKFRRKYARFDTDYIEPHHMSSNKAHLNRVEEIKLHKKTLIPKKYKFKGWLKSKNKVDEMKPSEIIFCHLNAKFNTLEKSV